MFRSVGHRLARKLIWKTFCERDRDSVCFVHHYESDWSFPMCVLQCQCGEQSRWPGHRDGYRVSPEPPQRARERAGTEESERNRAWVLSARNRWILKMQLSCRFEVITFQCLSLNFTLSLCISHSPKKTKNVTDSRHVWEKALRDHMVCVEL